MNVCMCVYQWWKWSWENREHQTTATVPVCHEPKLCRDAAYSEEHTRGASHRTEQVKHIPKHTHSLSIFMCTYKSTTFFLQPHHGSNWKCQNSLQQQLQSLWEIHSASFLSKREHPGRMHRRLYPSQSTHAFIHSFSILRFSIRIHLDIYRWYHTHVKKKCA